jgi:hypothetical protein
MPKAAKISILDLIKRHADLYREIDRLDEIEGDFDPSDTKEHKALCREIYALEPVVATARVYTSDEYAAQVKFINRVTFPGDDLIEIAWRLGRSARSLGIKRPPRLISHEAHAKMPPKAARRRLAKGEAEYREIWSA